MCWICKASRSEQFGVRATTSVVGTGEGEWEGVRTGGRGGRDVEGKERGNGSKLGIMRKREGRREGRREKGRRERQGGREGRKR